MDSGSYVFDNFSQFILQNLPNGETTTISESPDFVKLKGIVDKLLVVINTTKEKNVQDLLEKEIKSIILQEAYFIPDAIRVKITKDLTKYHEDMEEKIKKEKEEEKLNSLLIGHIADYIDMIEIIKKYSQYKHINEKILKRVCKIKTSAFEWETDFETLFNLALSAQTPKETKEEDQPLKAGMLVDVKLKTGYVKGEVVLSPGKIPCIIPIKAPSAPAKKSHSVKEVSDKILGDLKTKVINDTDLDIDEKPKIQKETKIVVNPSLSDDESLGDDELDKKGVDTKKCTPFKKLDEIL